MSIHDGHRKRMKLRFLEQGIDGFQEHEVLELLLFYGVPRGDVNPLAHRLIHRFGSLAGVLDASVEELMEVEGVGENTAVLLKLVPRVGRRYMMARAAFDGILLTHQQVGEYVLPRFLGERDEVVYLVCMDAKRKVLGCRLVGRGTVNSAAVSVRKIVETALSCNATQAVLAHNHTSGIALPSPEDEEATRLVAAALSAVDICLTDHLVVADDDFVSMAENGFFG